MAACVDFYLHIIERESFSYENALFHNRTVLNEFEHHTCVLIAA